MSILAWIVLGLIAGGVASLIVPGRTPGGVIGAILIGIVGAIVGGWVATVFFGADTVSGLNLYSMVIAVIGSVALLALARLLRTSA